MGRAEVCRPRQHERVSGAQRVTGRRRDSAGASAAPSRGRPSKADGFSKEMPCQAGHDGYQINASVLFPIHDDMPDGNEFFEGEVAAEGEEDVGCVV